MQLLNLQLQTTFEFRETIWSFHRLPNKEFYCHLQQKADINETARYRYLLQNLSYGLSTATLNVESLTEFTRKTSVQPRRLVVRHVELCKWGQRPYRLTLSRDFQPTEQQVKVRRHKSESGPWSICMRVARRKGVGGRWSSSSSTWSNESKENKTVGDENVQIGDEVSLPYRSYTLESNVQTPKS